MKFLNDTFNHKDIMPLNLYYDRGEFGKPDDVLDIIFKDMDTGKKYVETIVNPIIEIWIVKPDFRDKYTFIHDYYQKSECFPVRVHYKSRFIEIGKMLNIPADTVKFCPWLCQMDMDIRHFYLIQFILEYGNTRHKVISRGFLDIETDIINIDTFPEPGEVPINAVTYIDAERKEVYTLLLTTNNIIIYDKPMCDENATAMKRYKNRLKLKENFDKQMEEFKANIDNFPKKLEETFGPSYPGLKYHVLMFDQEIDLIITLWKIIKASDPDYAGIWNLPFDMQFLMTRPKVLGYNPNTIIVDKDAFIDKDVTYFEKKSNDTEYQRYSKEKVIHREISFYEDKNPLAHKRKHKCETFTKTTFADQLVNYGGIRSGKGKLESLRLNAIAKSVLKDTKQDYSEYGDIRHLPYLNYELFVIYNIKDVLLQFGIDNTTHDFDTMYSYIYQNAVLPGEIFTSTTKLQNSIRLFLFNDPKSMDEKGILLGSNRNKLYPPDENGFDLNKAINDSISESEDELDDSDLYEEDDDSDDENESEEESGTSKKKKKFKGAHVQNPLRIQPTGTIVLGSPSKFLHNNVPDMDITSEYPTAIIIMNACNDTMVGKFFLSHPEDLKLPIYPNFHLYKKDAAYSEYDVSNAVLEYYSEMDILSFGKTILGLPSPDDIISDFKCQDEEELEKYFKDEEA